MCGYYRYKVTISYVGTNYGGWQKQPNTNSIQEEIECVLSKMLKEDVIITASGRTDAKVHALGQVFHFDSNKQLEENNWKKALNSLLPRDIRVQSVKAVHQDFHARFDAVEKRYDYLITDDVDNPFVENYMAKDTKQLDVAYMQECANVFIGTYDFTSFTSNKIDPRKPRVKTISKLEIVKEGRNIRMIFVGTGFLRYMVRMISQTLIEAGKQRLTKEEIKDMLNSKDKHACRYKAPPQGLYLVHVRYKDDK